MRITIAVAAAIAATSVSFAVATAANHQPAAQASATDRAVVNQLKTLNREVKTLNDNIGSSGFDSDSLRYETRTESDDVEAAIESMCRAVAEHSFQC